MAEYCQTLAHSQMTPGQKNIAPLYIQISIGAHRQQNFGADVAIRPVGQHRRFYLLTQPVNHRLKLVAIIMRAEFKASELAHQNDFLPG